ncbi:MAG TPA: PAS domain S-box protein, partial [Planctomycetota bacterium]|nr:PAS domain S-box protein [Planctomycetota bacterium]
PLRDLELEVVRPDGERRSVIGNMAALPDGRGSLVAAFIDVTERRIAEIALRESERRLATVLEHMPFLFNARDADGKVLVWNRACERMTGFTAEDLVENPRGDELLYPDPDYRREVLARRAAAAADESIEVRLACKGGGERLVAWTPVDRRVPIPGWARWSVGIDITELRQAQSTMRRVLRAVEQAEESIVITDAAGTIEYVNPSVCRTSGYAASELVGRNPRVFQSGAHDRTFYADLWRTILAGETWRGHLTNRTKSGARFEEAAVIGPVRDERGAVVAFVAVKRSLEGEQKLEAQLRQAQKLEAVGQLAGGVAHDINNALSGVLGYCDLALLEAAPPRILEFLGEIRKSGDRAASIARQLLVFSRRQSLDLHIADVNAIVENLLKMLRRVIGENVAIATAFAADLPVASVDAGQIEQVLTNLCLNARDAMPEGGCITISTARAPAAHVPLADGTAARPAAPAADGLLLSVADTGSGMTEEVRAHIFEPFFTTKPRGKGTGLGLAVVHGIVAKHGGAIAVDTEPGRGSTFRIYLPPASIGATKREAARQDASLPGGSETVLVVDDDEMLRRVTARIVERLGYRTLVAAGAADAVEVAAGFPGRIDVLLTDVVMPGPSGIDLAERLARARPGLRVLFMSGHLPERMGAGARIAAEQLLPKPFTAAGLAAKLRETIEPRP